MTAVLGAETTLLSLESALMQRKPGMSWLMVGSTLAAATGGYVYLQMQLQKAREQQVCAGLSISHYPCVSRLATSYAPHT
jgi:D-tyrosyl-tRNA(Tyr) deacylase